MAELPRPPAGAAIASTCGMLRFLLASFVLALGGTAVVAACDKPTNAADSWSDPTLAHGPAFSRGGGSHGGGRPTGPVTVPHVPRVGGAGGTTVVGKHLCGDGVCTEAEADGCACPGDCNCKPDTDEGDGDGRDGDSN
jgi:hypothetical protein